MDGELRSNSFDPIWARHQYDLQFSKNFCLHGHIRQTIVKSLRFVEQCLEKIKLVPTQLN